MQTGIHARDFALGVADQILASAITRRDDTIEFGTERVGEGPTVNVYTGYGSSSVFIWTTPNRLYGVRVVEGSYVLEIAALQEKVKAGGGTITHVAIGSPAEIKSTHITGQVEKWTHINPSVYHYKDKKGAVVATARAREKGTIKYSADK